MPRSLSGSIPLLTARCWWAQAITGRFGRILRKGSHFDILTSDDPSTTRETVAANGVNAPPHSLALNQWQHFAVVYQGGTITFHKNGFRLAEPAAGSLGAVGTNDVVLGNTSADTSATNYFAGALDEVGIWSRV